MMGESCAFRTADRYLAGFFIHQGYAINRVVLEPNIPRPDGQVYFHFVFPAYEDFPIEQIENLANDCYASRIHVEVLTFSHAVKRAFGLINDAVHRARYPGGKAR